LAVCLWFAFELLFTTLSFISAIIRGRRERRRTTKRLRPERLIAEFVIEVGAAALAHFLVAVAAALRLRKRSVSLNVTTTPVLLIPGYFSNRGVWLFFTKLLRGLGAGHIHTIDPKPAWGDIRDHAKQVADVVDAILSTTGASQVNLVGHSMGGLIARYYIEHLGGAGKVGACVMLGTPNHGSLMSRVGVGVCAEQMRPGSAFLEELNKFESIEKRVKYVSIRSTFDNLLVPSGNAILGGNTKNIALDYMGHLTMLYSPKVARLVWENLRE
jgi:triacylglycerol lipase